MAVNAVVFDLDGVLVDSEQLWDSARREVVRDRGGRWTDTATRDMMGMSSPEWSRYLSAELAVPMSPEAINDDVVGRVRELYRRRLPALPGAREAIERLAGRFVLGLASSSNRPVIDLVLERLGVAAEFAATVSSEEVARGKPAPDVYLEAARRLAAAPERCTAVEDSSAGIRAAAAAGMAVIAIPNRAYPPEPALVAAADLVLDSLHQLGRDAVERGEAG